MYADIKISIDILSYPKLLKAIQAYLNITFFKRPLKQNPNKTGREDKIDNRELSAVD